MDDQTSETTLTDEEIETRQAGTAAQAEVPGPGDGTPDDSGDDESDTGDDSGDVSDATDTGDDSGDSGV